MRIIPAAHDGDNEGLNRLDLDLFGLEIEYQVQTRMRPLLKLALDAKDAQFQAELAQRPEVIAEQRRLAEARAEYQRRKERRAYVESGQAALAAEQDKRRNLPSIRELGQQLARHWNVPFIIDRRLNGSRPATA